jgi:ribosomal protein S1
MQKKKKTVNARIINIIKSGYAIGSSGLIGFLPKSRSFNCNIGFVYSFLILSLDNYHSSFIFLQNKIDNNIKRSTRIALKECTRIALKRAKVLKKLIKNN